jgi:hypothetical protein
MKTITIDKTELEKAFYAVVGAPVTAGRKLTAEAGKLQEIDLKAKTEEFKTKAGEFGSKVKDDLTSAYGEWSKVGAEVVGDLRTKVDVEDLTTKVGERVHVEQWQEQADKLRSQLEDLVGNWRANFAPEGEVVETVAVEVADMADLTVIDGVGPAYAGRLSEAGITDLRKLAKADSIKVAAVAKVAEKVASAWIAEAKTLV